MAGIGVVVNPHAGKNRRERERAEQFVRAVGSDGLVRQTGSLAEMAEVACEFRERRIDILAVCGGDGSFFRTLSAMLHAYGDAPLPRFLPLRAGSMNTIARSVGCRHGGPERVLAHIVADYRAGRPFELTERHLLRVNDQYFGFMVGAGVIVNFLRLYYGGKRRGPRAAAQVLARVVLSALSGTALARGLLQYTEADIDCDGERVPHRRFNLIYASSITEIGLGCKATYLATRKRGYFHLLAGPVRALQVIRRLRRLRHGWPLAIDTLYDNLAQRVRVEFPRPTHYMIDGDICDAVTVLDVTTGPRLTIICK
ncbi:MAG: diacylglycerol/lipid kinase family protein [Candidatus Binatia bacterium]